MQANGMIFWDWNGTLMDDLDFTQAVSTGCWETHGYPQAVRSCRLPGNFRFSH